jgi:hypothetical protein
MANTYVQIGSTITVGTNSPAFVEFTSIPQTFTDLVVIYSLNSTDGPQGIYTKFNGSNLNFSGVYGYSDGASNLSGFLARYLGSIAQTAATFTNGRMYIQNYTTSNAKVFSVDETYPRNSTPSFINMIGGLWSNSAAITSVMVGDVSGLQQYSSVSLYGIKNS